MPNMETLPFQLYGPHEIESLREAFHEQACSTANAAAGVVFNSPSKRIKMNGEDGVVVDGDALLRLSDCLKSYDQAMRDYEFALAHQRVVSSEPE